MTPDDDRALMALERIADELEDLNDHALAYLETMALNILTPCGPDATMEDRTARETSAIKLLKHVEQYR